MSRAHSLCIHAHRARHDKKRREWRTSGTVTAATAGAGTDAYRSHTTLIIWCEYKVSGISSRHVVSDHSKINVHHTPTTCCWCCFCCSCKIWVCLYVGGVDCNVGEQVSRKRLVRDQVRRENDWVVCSLYRTPAAITCHNKHATITQTHS